MDQDNNDIKQLLRKIASDDNDAFRIFYERYYLQLFRVSSYFVKSIQVMEEIVSDVFCTIWQNRKKIPDIENFEGYLYTIVKNKALYYLNRDNKLSITEVEFISQDIISDIETPESIAIDKEFTSSLKKAINELPDRCRVIFLMAREEGLKYEEIAEILNISEKTVNAQMVLAIRKLSKLLGKIIFFII